MRLTGAQMEALVTLVDAALERGALYRIVKYRLEVDADAIVPEHSSKLDAVFAIIDWATRRQREQPLLDGIMKENPAIEAALRKLLEEAQRADTVTPAAGVAAAPADPLDPFFPQAEPFVDRADLTSRLDDLWKKGRSGVLVVRGERYSGRSHSWWRIVDAARAAGVSTCRVDVSRDPGTWKVGLFVERVAVLLRVDRQRLKDGLAQGSTQAAALVTELVDRFAGRPANAGRYCLVLDGLDRPGVDPAIIELVEELIAEVLAANIPGLSLIILGYGQHKEQAFKPHILTEDIHWLQPTDIQRWLAGVAQAAGKAVADNDVVAKTQIVLDGLAAPFDATAMDELHARVRREATDLLRRLP